MTLKEKKVVDKEGERVDAFSKYKKDSRAWGAWAESAVSINSPDAILKLVPILKKHGVEKVIDVGCGNGRNSLLLAKEGFNVVAFDYSAEALKTVRDRAKDEKLEVHTLLGTVKDMQMIPDGMFDAVISCHVVDLYKMHDIKKVVNELKRILKSEGIAMIVVFSDDSKMFRDRTSNVNHGVEIEKKTVVYNQFEAWHNLMYHFFSKKEMKELFKDFKILSLEKMRQDEDKFWVLVAEKIAGS